jgi:carbon-monoxide dehydrogenase small subunit
MSQQPESQIDIVLTVNGVHTRQRVEARRHLADFLREALHLTGTHVGCEHGVCGACTVRVDGKIVRACLMLAVQCNGSVVETIEVLQREFRLRNALQCGLCTPGMLITAADLLSRTVRPTRDEIREHLSGNYCRCTGYHAIVDAVDAAIAEKVESERQP